MSTALRTHWRGATLAAMQDHVAGVTRTYHLDHQGTVQCLTDDNGVVTDRFSCDAWGNEFKRTGTSVNRQWYIGHLGYYRQVDQVLDYVRARYYDAERASWLSRDPMMPAPPYGYGGNSPTSETDPTGLWPLPRVPWGCRVVRGPQIDRSYGGGQCHQPPTRDGASVIATAVVRITARVQCVYPKYGCPPDIKWSFCQGMRGTRSEGDRLEWNIQKWCPDNDRNKDSDLRTGPYTCSVPGKNWIYAGHQNQYLVSEFWGYNDIPQQQVCEYELCMWDAPGYANFSPAPGGGCCRPGSHVLETRFPRAKVPGEFHMQFISWPCENTDNQRLPRAGEAVSWGMDFSQVGTSRQSCRSY